MRGVLAFNQHICPIAVAAAFRAMSQPQIYNCYLHIPRVVKQSSACPSWTWIPSCSAIKFLHTEKQLAVQQVPTHLLSD